MKYEVYILTQLLDRYERSKGFLTNVHKRRILYKPETDHVLTKTLIDPAHKAHFISALTTLKQQNLLDFSWEPFEENNLVHSIWLKLEIDALTKSYAYCGRVSKSQQIQEIIEILVQCLGAAKTKWITELLQNIIYEAQANQNSWNFILSTSQTKDFCQVLLYLDNLSGKLIDKRILSVYLFADSKYFERTLQSKFLTIVAQYIVEWDDEITEREKLQQIGIGISPEIIYFTGPLSITFKNNCLIDYGCFEKGVYLGSDMLEDIAKIEGEYTDLITIENLTNYYWYIKHKRRANTLVFYTGGFLTQNQVTFLKKLTLKPTVELKHWGDLDLGGFRILLHIQNILPNIYPYKMDSQTFNFYAASRKSVSPTYIKKVEIALTKKEYKPFKEILELIIETKSILEQEAELY